MNIKTKDYDGDCRRGGGGKLKLTLSDLLKVLGTIFIPLVVLVVIGTVAWTNIKADVIDLEEKALEVKDLPKQMVAVQKDIGSIQSDVGELKTDVNTIMTDIKTLLGRNQ